MPTPSTQPEGRTMTREGIQQKFNEFNGVKTTGNPGDKKSEPIPGIDKPKNDIDIGTVPTALGSPIKFICNVCGTTGDAITVNNYAVSHLMITPTQRATTWEERLPFHHTTKSYSAHWGSVEFCTYCGEYREDGTLDADEECGLRKFLASELALQADRVRKATDDVIVGVKKEFWDDQDHAVGGYISRKALQEAMLAAFDKALSNQE